MSIQLRPYQQQLIDAVRGQFNKKFKRVVAVAPCGAGKTIITGWMIRESLKRGKRSIFFVHRQELIDQTANTFLRLDIPFGIIAAGVKMKLDRPVQIASVQTLARRIDKIPAPDFLICDECHHILANTYKKVLDAFPRAYLLGVTATPLRMGGVTLSDVFQSMVQSLSVNQLINLGNLTKFKYIAPSLSPDLERQLKHARSSFGEFINSDLERIMNSKEIIGNIVDAYLNHANGKSAICYCVNVNHSKTVAKAFNDAGIPAAHCDGDTKPIVRNALVNDFRNGKISVLCNADLFGEGFDVPRCQAVILARPTQSLTLFIQQSMRPLRPDPDDPNKVAVIIDLVQNRARHGFPNDERDWSLIPKLKHLIDCPNCSKKIKPLFDGDFEHCKELQAKKIHRKGEKFRVDVPIEPFLKGEEVFEHRYCPFCGYIFQKGDSVGGSKQPRYAQGDIEELNVQFDCSDTHDQPRVHLRPTTIEQFIQIAEERHYKGFYWAAKQALQFAKSEDDCKHIGKMCGYKPGWAYHAWQELQEFPPETRNALLTG